jgi:hypothetical protein
MTELDAELGPIGLELIAEFGKSIGFRRISNQEYDPATGTSVKDETATVQIRALVEDTAGMQLSQLVEGASKKLTISALALSVSQETLDEYDIDGSTYTAKQIATIYSGDLPCLYTVWVGK